MSELHTLKKLLAHPALDAKPGEEARSPHWPAVRKKFLEGKTCAACGGSENLEAHHVEPFHVEPAKELDPTNLIALCEHPGRDCHFRFGHFFDWKDWNDNVRADAAGELKRVAKHEKHDAKEEK